MTNPNDPAFSQQFVNHEGKHVSCGLTKREWFAGMAMQGFLSNPHEWNILFKVNRGTFDWEHIAEASNGMTNALLAELNKEIE